MPGLIAAVQSGEAREFTDEEIIDCMMIPMIIETARCLEEGIVDTPNEVDMGLIMGIGFPPFRGGALKYADLLGMDVVCARPTSTRTSESSMSRPQRCVRWRQQAQSYG